ncbi:hypothetical protein B484DRAFT_481481 [Ochromonadaceae sp. CCMP2298]|nr:hypothetical protein B484DRAFT_481481 [Ochromonadaceae sp. CCMP2298]
MRTSPEGCADVLIRSTDLDWTKFSCQNVLRMRELFPEAGDETIARYLTARGDDLQKATVQYKRAQERSYQQPLTRASFEDIDTGLYVRGVDKQGRPILVFATRKRDQKSAENKVNSAVNSAETALLAFFIEHVIRRMAPNVTKYTLLVDRTGGSDGAVVALVRHVAEFQPPCLTLTSI